MGYHVSCSFHPLSLSSPFPLFPCSYLRQVEDEVLRVNPLGAFASHVSSEDMTVDGCHVPAGTPIIQATGVAFKNETTWQEGELEE